MVAPSKSWPLTTSPRARPAWTATSASVRSGANGWAVASGRIATVAASLRGQHDQQHRRQSRRPARRHRTTATRRARQATRARHEQQQELPGVMGAVGSARRRRRARRRRCRRSRARKRSRTAGERATSTKSAIDDRSACSHTSAGSWSSPRWCSTGRRRAGTGTSPRHVPPSAAASRDGSRYALVELGMPSDWKSEGRDGSSSTATPAEPAITSAHVVRAWARRRSAARRPPPPHDHDCERTCERRQREAQSTQAARTAILGPRSSGGAHRPEAHQHGDEQQHAEPVRTGDHRVLDAKKYPRQPHDARRHRERGARKRISPSTTTTRAPSTRTCRSPHGSPVIHA